MIFLPLYGTVIELYCIARRGFILWCSVRLLVYLLYILFRNPAIMLISITGVARSLLMDIEVVMSAGNLVFMRIASHS